MSGLGSVVFLLPTFQTGFLGKQAAPDTVNLNIFHSVRNSLLSAKVSSHGTVVRLHLFP